MEKRTDKYKDRTRSCVRLLLYLSGQSYMQLSANGCMSCIFSGARPYAICLNSIERFRRAMKFAVNAGLTAKERDAIREPYGYLVHIISLRSQNYKYNMYGKSATFIRVI